MSWYDNYKPSLLLVSTSVILVYRIALTIVMIVMTIAHVNKYTYWNYFGQTFFYFALWLSMITKYPYLYKLLSLFIFPIAFGSVFFVQFFIEVVLQLDGGEQFISATTLDGGNASVGTVHTFDFLVHTCPVLDMFIILCSGYLFELRTIICTLQSQLQERRERYVFMTYVFTVPLFPLAVYCTIFNPFKEYTTSASPIIIVLIAAVIYSFIVWWLWKILTSRFTGHFTIDTSIKSNSRSSSSTNEDEDRISSKVFVDNDNNHDSYSNDDDDDDDDSNYYND